MRKRPNLTIAVTILGVMSASLGSRAQSIEPVSVCLASVQDLLSSTLSRPAQISAQLFFDFDMQHLTATFTGADQNYVAEGSALTFADQSFSLMLDSKNQIQPISVEGRVLENTRHSEVISKLTRQSYRCYDSQLLSR